MKLKTLAASLVVAFGTVALPAMAADPTPPDGQNIVAYIVAAGVTMSLVASSKFLMELGIKAWHWIRKALA